MLRFICFFSLTLCLASCVSEQDVVSSEQYFDLPHFIENEIVDLEKNNTQLYKKVYTDGEYDSVLIDKPDWKKELQVFANININKPAFIGKYKVVKTDEQGFQATVYGALDDELQVKTFTLLMREDTIKGILVFKDAQSLFLDNNILLEYFVGKSYHVKGYRNLLGVKTNYEVWAELR